MPSAIVVAPFSNQPLRNVSNDSDQYQISGLLDNIRSAYNVGSMIRTASAAGFVHLNLCGITPTPKHPKVAKTSLGAEQCVSWSHHNNSIDVAAGLHARGHQLIAIEGGIQSQWLSEFSGTGEATRVTMIVGNELSGVDPALLEMCDQVLALPMLGNKTSLNVTVAFGIAAYYLQYFPLLNTTHIQDVRKY
jgi:tRNA G18 (ribose-2'-O)-methylase SpoU